MRARSDRGKGYNTTSSRGGGRKRGKGEEGCNGGMREEEEGNGS